MDYSVTLQVKPDSDIASFFKAHTHATIAAAKKKSELAMDEELQQAEQRLRQKLLDDAANELSLEKQHDLESKLQLIRKQIAARYDLGGAVMAICFDPDNQLLRVVPKAQLSHLPNSWQVRYIHITQFDQLCQKGTIVPRPSQDYWSTCKSLGLADAVWMLYILIAGEGLLASLAAPILLPLLAKKHLLNNQINHFKKHMGREPNDQELAQIKQQADIVYTRLMFTMIFWTILRQFPMGPLAMLPISAAIETVGVLLLFIDISKRDQRQMTPEEKRAFNHACSKFAMATVISVALWQTLFFAAGLGALTFAVMTAIELTHLPEHSAHALHRVLLALDPQSKTSNATDQDTTTDQTPHPEHRGLFDKLHKAPSQSKTALPCRNKRCF